tara:strand:+ start:2626 stop:2916 length:291 start_codon:yes stop_codon:yes gene_type:complete
VVQFYPSCELCNSPAGVILYKFGPEEMKTWGCHDLPEMSLDEEAAFLPVLHPDKLRKKITDYMEAALDEVLEEFAPAVNQTINDFYKEGGQQNAGM